MVQYYLAVDIGASSGRHILGSVQDGRIVLEEVYRFQNGMKQKDGHLCWDVEELAASIRAGMKRCREIGKIPVSVGVDTWGVDFVLLDEHDRIVGETVGYRDGRTKGMDDEVYKIISPEKLYARTGIQKQIYNTVYQLMAVKRTHPEYLETAKSLLMMPDYFHFSLTGIRKQEYTIATTSQLVSPDTKQWDYELIGMLGYPRELFGPLSVPGTVVGSLSPEVQAEVGYDCLVVLPPSHDTASAVAAVPSNAEDTLYISSGTWSLLGTELLRADCSENSMRRNFANEGGYQYRFRYLKNIMGLWMIQSVKKELAEAGEEYSFAQLCDMAAGEDIPSIVSCNDDVFLAPESMIRALRDACAASGQRVPETPAQLAAVIYNSLACCYRDTIEELEHVTGKHYGQIHIVGGGSNADYLNELTAGYTGRTVYAGPTEATAIGNLAVQMIRAGEYKTLTEAREAIFRSFEVRTFTAPVSDAAPAGI